MIPFIQDKTFQFVILMGTVALMMMVTDGTNLI